MLKFNIKNLIKMRGVREPMGFLMKHGFTRNESGRIANEKIKMLKLKQIERLCRAFKCEPNHLFAYEGEAEAGQPMTELRAVTDADMRYIEADIPLGKLEEFRRKVEEVKRGM
jgi:DNA-binding Xre family transcriptional regulator